MKSIRLNLSLSSALLLGFLLAAPMGVSAQTKDVQWYLEAISGFINDTLIPFFFAIAILFLLINITRLFIIDGADVGAHEQARKYVMYAIIGLVFLSSIWGVINIVIRSFGIDGNLPICPDYNPDCDDSGGEFD